MASIWRTKVFTENTVVTLKDVTTFTISNDGKFDIEFINDGYSRTLLASQNPVDSFSIESGCCPMDLNFEVKCPTGSTVVLDYGQINPC